MTIEDVTPAPDTAPTGNTVADEIAAIRNRNVEPTQEESQTRGASANEDAQEADVAEPEQPATETDETTSDGHADKGVGKKLNALEREKYAALRRAELAEQALEEARRAAQDAPMEKEPRPEDFEYDQAKYIRAIARWETQQARQEIALKEQQRQQQAQQQERDRRFQERVNALEAKEPGKWGQAISAPIRYTEPMLEVVGASEVGPEIAVYLSEHLDQADAIAKMSPYVAAAALGKIEASLHIKAAAPVKKVTTAPKPPATLKGGKANIAKELADMDLLDHIRAVRAQRHH